MKIREIFALKEILRNTKALRCFMQIGQGLKIFSKVVSTKPTKTHASQLGPLDNSLLTHSHHKGHFLSDFYANCLNIKEYFGKID